MYRTSVIIRHTFHEAIVQPIYSLLLGLGIAILTIFGLLPFFTLGEDTIMFKAVGLDVILLLVLIATLFACSKSIFDEIEDRTMLTLMSKPVKKWEVLAGKYIGIALSALVAVSILGVVLILATYWRIPGDYMIRANSLDDRELRQLFEIREMHILGLIPSLLLVWLQIAVLAAIGVALSTRFSLVVNLPVVIFLYIAGNLTRFLFPLTSQDGALYKGFAWVISTILPYLETFDLRARTVYATIAVPGTHYGEQQYNTVFLGQIWTYVGIAALYAIVYAIFALSAGMWIFQNRELGGSEG